MNKKLVIFIIAVILVLAVGTYKMTGNIINNPVKVKLETNQGDIVINLYSDMPITSGNFKN